MMPEDRKLLYKLIEQWTRSEIMARFGPFWPESGDYAMAAIEKIDEIRELVFGTKNLVELGQRWGLIKPNEKERMDRRGSRIDKKPERDDDGRRERGRYCKGDRKPLL